MRQAKRHERHPGAGARMLEFGGRDFPVPCAAGPRAIGCGPRPASPSTVRKSTKTPTPFARLAVTAVPRQGYPIAAEGRRAGRVTPEFSTVSQQVEIVIRDTPKAARVVARPSYKSSNWR